MFAFPAALATEAQFRQRILGALARFPDLATQPTDVRRERDRLIARVAVGAGGPVFEWAFPLPAVDPVPLRRN
ncbi:hypothetical protein D3C84_1287090 [compost metagenome]